MGRNQAGKEVQMKKLACYLLAILMTFSVVIVGSALAETDKQFFEGKTIKMLIPFGPGGGVDVFTRTIAKSWGKHIPGNPTIIVVNKPGGGGGKAFTIIYKRTKPDGLTTISATPGVLARWLTKKRGHTTYDLTKMRLVTICPSATVHFLSTRLGMRSVEELISSGKKIKSSITDVGSTIAVTDRMAAKLLGFPHKQVSGYRGAGECILGLQRGEVDLTGCNSNAYKTSVIPLVKSGEIVVLYQSGIFDAAGNIVRDPRMPEVPTAEEVYKKIYKKTPTGRAWGGLKAGASAQTVGMALWLPPKVPQERIQVLENALKSMVSSVEFKNEVENILGTGTVFMIGEEAQPVFRTFAETPPEIVKLF